MSSLPNPRPIVESDRTFRLRLALEESQERDRIEQTYPILDPDAPDPTALPNGDPAQYYPEPTEAPEVPRPLTDAERDELPEGVPDEAGLARDWDLGTVFEPSEADRAEAAQFAETLPVISGGAPATHEPTCADWEDYARNSRYETLMDDVRREESLRNPMWGYE